MNFPIYVYDLRDSFTYKPLNLGSTDPIALSIVTHISTALRGQRPHLFVIIMYLFLENVNESGKIVLVLAAVSFEVALNDTIASLTHLALLTAKMYHMHQ